MKSNSKELFIRDIEILESKLMKNYGNISLNDVKNRLIQYYELGLTNINNSSIQMILSAYLKSLGYRVFVEYEKQNRLFDVYAVKDDEIGIEVEYGYVPNSIALNPEEYLRNKLALKILRYSNFTSKFYIAVPSFYLPPIPKEVFELEKEKRIKALITMARKNSKVIDINDIQVRDVKLNGIMIINISDLKVRIMDIRDYMKLNDLYK